MAHWLPASTVSASGSLSLTHNYRHAGLHTDITDIWYLPVLYIGGNDNIYEHDAFSQRRTVGYWWVSLCTITYEWKEGEREERERWEEGIDIIASSLELFHQSSQLETLVVLARARRASLTQCILLLFSTQRLLSWAFLIHSSERREWRKAKETGTCENLYTYLAM